MDDDDLVILTGLALFASTPASRRAGVFREQMDWLKECSRLIVEREFYTTLRMSPSSYEKIVCMLAPRITVDDHFSILRTGMPAMCPHNQLQLTIAYLTGGMMVHLRRLVGTSRKNFYVIVYRVLNAIINHEKLALRGRFPVNDSKYRAATNSFQRDSTHGAIAGCIGAVDGWLAVTNRPDLRDIGNVDAGKYYSGHYMCFGLNMSRQLPMHTVDAST